MGVEDVRPKSSRGAESVPREPEMASSSSRAAVDYRSFDLVPSSRELTLEVGDEDPEIGVVGAGVHLGYEEDSHGVGNRDDSGTIL